MSDTGAPDIAGYPTLPQFSTLPSAMAVPAVLFGRKPVPLSRARVLELGCGSGGNILSLAVIAPGASFVGIDASQARIAMGTALAEAAEIVNLTLTTADILDPRAVEGEFDYIIASNVYSSVGDNVREAMMALAGRALTANGLLFVGYAAAPGANNRRTLRTVLFDATRHIEEPDARVRVAHDTLQSYLPVWGGLGPAGEALRLEAETMMARYPGELVHGELGAIWEPQLITDVVAAAGRNGLFYLSDSTPTYSSEAVMPSERFPSLGERDWVHLQQLSDFALQRPSRQSLFVRGEVGWPHLDWHALRTLWAQTAAPQDSGSMAHGDESGFATLLAKMAEAYPQAVGLQRIGEATAAAVVRHYFSGELELFTEPHRLTIEPGKRPEASGLARAQAALGHAILATLRHHPLDMGDAGARYLIQQLDGTRELPELGFAMAAFAHTTWEDAMARLPAALRQLARLGLLIG